MAQAKYTPLAASGLYSTPGNTMGTGNPEAPCAEDYSKTTGIGDTAGDFHSQETGSGDLIV